MPSPEITAAIQEDFARSLAGVSEQARNAYNDPRLAPLKPLFFAFFEAGYIEGGKKGAEMAGDRMTTVAMQTLATGIAVGADIAKNTKEGGESDGE